MQVRVQENDFEVATELAAIRRNRPQIGAIACFVGLVRDISEHSEVSELTLEHYPGMTEKALQVIVDQAAQRWQIIDARVVHRVGRLRPSDQIVLVAVATEHRGDAFAACEFIIDDLKTRAPFWKREVTPSGARWVEARQADEQASERWRP
ncbi:MAG TPA: molybdenum cofactor biosynthesis protein MoaE [Accumulibacter sp.]|uniref:molybdenum cofactor biosynthesis protein MoaE n=1 Tax=Accumulibacter sp. TaxID=2053492 RepID=UPI00260DBA59|nr:molybdenum cofactor biosynthesis protein MoaE [Accumulibacter sp.]MDS4055454.1 molybdenum cofactor biosynthesis protein MoaE [Accumulibacter sp.]HMV04156.1 molybdenum cofactor biosynthesis protein MoaE [Accumulibacter sp.]HMW64067.1 molybdenum cofactor biosynthesis protein MoaE [Accumulibacter sp.]HMW79931.1 molybdenum cofactor biosynthesis protein MoaE [Accumulibacter sp.]HNB66567.1 molybdenum cofactor biosynthesis protein MoaE [Accumulibacter sp.]